MTVQDRESFAWSEILAVAEGMLREDVDPIEGCRLISRYRADLKEPGHKLLLPFIGVDSETEAFPLGTQRDFWGNEALARQDRERESYLQVARESIMAACRELIHYFDQKEHRG